MFSEHFPNTLSKKLSQNFRSPQKIVSIANHLIQHNQHRSTKTIHTDIEGGNVRIERFQNEECELLACANRIQEWLNQGVPPNEIAALCRNLDMVQALRAQLYTLGISVAGENPLLTPEGNQILALLHFVFRKTKLSQAINVGQRRMRK